MVSFIVEKVEEVDRKSSGMTILKNGQGRTSPAQLVAAKDRACLQGVVAKSPVVP